MVPAATSNTSAPVLLISTDFDGTLVEHGNPAPFAPLLMEVLKSLRAQNVRWAINTGRTLPSMEEGLESFTLSERPDFALTSEREVYRPSADGRGWEDFGEWNKRCAQAHRELFEDNRAVFNEMAAHLKANTGATPLYEKHVRAGASQPDPAGLVTETDGQMDGVVAYLDTLKERVPKFGYQRNTIYLRFCHADYDKGVALSELGRLIDVPADSIFAVGDHHNDIPMLTGVHARHVACPGNAIEAVKQVVAAAGGYVAQAGYSAGVIEALRHFCTHCELPA